MRFAVVRLLTEMRSLLACRRGQVAIIFAFAATMLFIAIGMGIDLWQGFVVKARLQAAVDAAALAIASTDRSAFTPSQLDSKVMAFINANYPGSALGELCSAPGSPVTCPNPALTYGATPNIIKVTYAASVPTTFMRIINYNLMPVSATGQATAAWQNIDFYLLLDTSPSMAIPASLAGINLMVSKTKKVGTSSPAGSETGQQENNDGHGCAFACHEANPQGEWSGKGLNNVNPTTGLVDKTLDNYALAQLLPDPVTGSPPLLLRIDNLRTAVANLMTTAQTTMAQYTGVSYRAAIYTFDVYFNDGVAPHRPVIQPLTADLTAAGTAANNISLQMVYDNNNRLNPVLTTTGNTHTLVTTGSTHSNIHLTGLASTVGVAVGQTVTGAGIPIGATVTTVVSGTAVDISSAATASASVSITFYFKKLDSLASTSGVAVGQVVFGAGIAGSTTVTATSGSSVTLSNSVTAAANGVAVTFGTTTNNSDADTSYQAAMTAINAIMPQPGSGTQSPGDTPKEVLFFVTDGVDDEVVAGCTTSATVDCYNAPPLRQESVMDPSYCDAIKNKGGVGKGPLIAILYTEYLPLPNNSWYDDGSGAHVHVAKYQAQIGATLQSCASPNLYFEVLTGGDISAALTKLFNLAVNAVYLSG